MDFVGSSLWDLSFSAQSTYLEFINCSTAPGCILVTRFLIPNSLAFLNHFPVMFLSQFWVISTLIFLDSMLSIILLDSIFFPVLILVDCKYNLELRYVSYLGYWVIWWGFFSAFGHFFSRIPMDYKGFLPPSSLCLHQGSAWLYIRVFF